MSPKPQPWYAKFNQSPRSPKDGRNRKAAAQTHRDPADRADRGPGADPADDYTIPIRTSLSSATWRTINVPSGITYHNPFYPDPTPPTIPYAGVRAGEIIGHRMWWVLNNNRLCSLAHYFLWEPGAIIEGNIDEEVESNVWSFLGPKIYGGVYSYDSPSFIAAELVDDRILTTPLRFEPFGTSYTCYGIAVGTIKCWGEVIEHEKGYRAQYAKLHSIDFVIGAINLQTLRTKYNV